MVSSLPHSLLAYSLLQEGKSEEAVRLHQRARRLHLAAGGPTHREVARDLSLEGCALCDLGRLEEAAAAFKESSPPPPHPP